MSLIFFQIGLQIRNIGTGWYNVETWKVCLQQSGLANDWKANTVIPQTNEDLGARNRYLRQGKVIASHIILWDAITYPCLRYLFLAPTSSNIPWTMIVGFGITGRRQLSSHNGRNAVRVTFQRSCSVYNRPNSLACDHCDMFVMWYWIYIQPFVIPCFSKLGHHCFI